MCIYEDVDEWELRELAEGLAEMGGGDDIEKIISEYAITWRERPYFVWWYEYFKSRYTAGGDDDV